ncbi:MAG: gliding motility-associated ABC transporter permease subunit GldF [Saprospiraceae bacterium]|jgi:ABC-2 type transport system permease protein|nr:gliding motility-associated ABC transporter permease subunit GldF [Saprospiraceae bacterium]MBL0026808.1 gliding motility-associated ABC transporter permease subunit GldF [Saprospiraceae bacterium]
MLSVFLKEIRSFFSSLTGYLVITIFLLSVGLFMWVFSDTSVLEYNFATMDQLFSIAPLVFLFLIPAITMKTIADEKSKGTLELLFTKPISASDIILGKYFANVSLVVLALVPTLIYYYSIFQLGSPQGNLDSGAILGSYIGLFFLGGAFVAIGMFASSLTDNQIVAFILGAFLCFFFHWAFMYLASSPIFRTWNDLLIQKIGINYHYNSISKGVIDSRDIVYFISVIVIFIYATIAVIKRQK